ncbi:hypothetical protein T06_5446 [Trichinella sp. T6]|nr:hypothetical protein T06_5446 [Trichinella sp. T6]
MNRNEMREWQSKARALIKSQSHLTNLIQMWRQTLNQNAVVEIILSKCENWFLICVYLNSFQCTEQRRGARLNCADLSDS